MIKDKNNIFKKEGKIAALKKRYLRDFSMDISYKTKNGKFESMDDLKVQVLDIIHKGKRFKITEYFNDNDGGTDHIILEYERKGQVKSNKFFRFLDAEITMIDKISEDE